LDFEAEKEAWSVYRLENKASLKVKQVVAHVFRLTERKKPDGSPVYVIQATAIADVSDPEYVVTVSEMTAR
jgi:hypothetical protein